MVGYWCCGVTGRARAPARAGRAPRARPPGARVLVDRQRRNPRAHRAESLPGRGVSELLHHHDVAGPHERPRDERERELASARDDEARGIGVEPAGGAQHRADRDAQALLAERLTVIEDPGPAQRPAVRARERGDWDETKIGTPPLSSSAPGTRPPAVRRLGPGSTERPGNPAPLGTAVRGPRAERRRDLARHQRPALGEVSPIPPRRAPRRRTAPCSDGRAGIRERSRVPGSRSPGRSRPPAM